MTTLTAIATLLPDTLRMISWSMPVAGLVVVLVLVGLVVGRGW